MIKLEKICIGNLMQCTKYERNFTFQTTMNIENTPCFSDGFGYIEQESELLKENVVLLKVKNGGYVTLDSINSLRNYFAINRCLTKNGYELGKIMLTTCAWEEGYPFVDEKSLKTIEEKEMSKNYHDIKLLQKRY